MIHTTGRRTTLRPGREADYERIHASIPEPLLHALAAAGVIRWHIWRDGSQLFHSIDTRHGYDAMVTEIMKVSPVDAEWDLIIDSLLESRPGADTILDLVWAMDDAGQRSS